jgi:hypothetical protein
MNFDNEANRLGGTDFEDWNAYCKPDGLPSYNKPDHFERSCVHQPNHSKALKKMGMVLPRSHPIIIY